MKKRTSICISLAVLLLIVSLCGKRAMATEELLSEMNESTDSILDDIAVCLQSAGFELDDNYSVSNAFLIQNCSVDDNYLFFVFYNDRCIGEYVTSQSTGGSSFFQEKCDIITSLYNARASLCVTGFGEESWGIVSGEEVVYLYGQEVIKDKNQLNCYAAKQILLHDLSSNILDNYGVETRQLIDESKYLNTPVRMNAAVNGVGLCWVASALSMIDYNNGTTGYTTLSLYYHLESLYSSTYGTPTGTVEYIVRTFNTFSINVVTAQNGLTFNSVRYLIDDYKPVMSVIMNSGLTASHAVVINGYHKFSTEGLTSYYSYRIMDPNCSSYVIVSANGSNTNYTYNAGGLIYTLWTSRYHRALYS